MYFKSFIALSALTLSIAAYGQGNTMNEDAAVDPTRIPSSDQLKVPTQLPSIDTNANTVMSPKDVCQKIAELEKLPNVKSAEFDQFILKHETAHRTASKMKGKMMSKNWLKDEIGSADCTTETIAGDHAFVVTKSGTRERLLPFVKQGNMWKLDSMAYNAIYRMERMPASSDDHMMMKKK